MINTLTPILLFFLKSGLIKFEKGIVSGSGTGREDHEVQRPVPDPDTIQRNICWIGGITFWN